MPRLRRADEAGGICDALNRGNARTTNFKGEADYDVFEQTLAEGLEHYPSRVLSLPLVPNH